jgi:hypothetical protein
LLISGTPNIFFKAFYKGTYVGKALRKMSNSKAVPDGLNSQECERNTRWSKLSIPYIPKRDVVQESFAIDHTTSMMKLTLAGKLELRVLVWAHVTPKQFLTHVQAALDAIRQKVLLEPYEKACLDEKVSGSWQRPMRP